MPLKLEISVGENEFRADGDFTLADAVPAIKEWGRLIGLPPGQEAIDSLATRLKQNNDALQTAVDAHLTEGT